MPEKRGCWNRWDLIYKITSMKQRQQTGNGVCLWNLKAFSLQNHTSSFNIYAFSTSSKFIIASWVFSALTCISNALMLYFLWFSPNIRPNPHSYPLRQLLSWVVCFEVVFNSVFFQNSGPRHIRRFHSHQGHLEISGNIYNCHMEQDLLVFGEDGPRKLVNIPHTA